MATLFGIGHFSWVFDIQTVQTNSVIDELKSLIEGIDKKHKIVLDWDDTITSPKQGNLKKRPIRLLQYGQCRIVFKWRVGIVKSVKLGIGKSIKMSASWPPL